MPTIRIGDYRHRVVFQNPGPPIPDAGGGYTHSWTDLVPASWDVAVDPTAAHDSEHAAAGGSAVATTPTLTIRGRMHLGVSTATRMIFEGRIYAITGARAADAHRSHMELSAVERV